MSQDPRTLIVQFFPNAGLGNQMFEWASGYSIAKTLGMEFQCMWKPSSKREFGLHHFGIQCVPYTETKLLVNRPGQGNRAIYDETINRIKASKAATVAICSPSQTEDCFIDHADDIREKFRLEPVALPHPDGTTPVGVQVRRGDYVTHSRLNVTTPTYFVRAMAMMRSRVDRPHFIMVSDDPAWCQRTFGHLTDLTVIPPQSPIDGMRTLASCEAHIISNSTFGWWGAWLGEKGPVIAPDKWYTCRGGYGEWEPVPSRWLRCPTSPAEHVNVMEAPKHERAIVYPWSEIKARWHELRYSLRSVHENFEDKDCPIYILGSGRPGFLLLTENRVKFLDSWSYKDALVRGVQLADKVLWMNDDICILKPTTWEHVSVPLHLGPVGPDLFRQLEKGNPWHRGMQRVISHMQAVGITEQFIYSTHTPYVYEREKALACMKEYGAFDKMPLEMCYFNSYVPPGQGVRITTERAQGPDFGDARYLNYTDAMLKDPLKQAIAARFPNFAPWELKRPF